jgi:hypothetical protein
LRSELEWSRKAPYGQLRRWFGVLSVGCTVVKSNERLGVQIGLSRKTVGEGFEELEQLRLIHIEGPAKGIRDVYFHHHPWMENPAAVPTWAKLGQVGKNHLETDLAQFGTTTWAKSARILPQLGP